MRADKDLRYLIAQAHLVLCAGNLPAPAVAQHLEQLANQLLELAAQTVAAANDGLVLGALPANDTPGTTLDRLAATLRQTVRGISWLPEDRCALWVEALSEIWLRPLAAAPRLLALAHECCHVRLRSAPHAEVWYLTLALLVPSARVALIPARRSITAESLAAVSLWPTPYEILALRATILRRAEEVGQTG